jgi:YHS domain-containing protein
LETACGAIPTAAASSDTRSSPDRSKACKRRSLVSLANTLKVPRSSTACASVKSSRAASEGFDGSQAARAPTTERCHGHHYTDSCISQALSMRSTLGFCSIGNIPLAAILWAGGISFAGVIAFIYADLITLPILLVYRKYYGTHFAVKLTGLMLAAIVIAALAIDAIFSAAGLIPESRLSIESVSDRGISLSYTALLNAIFTLAGGLLLWLTIRRGVTDPVCGMRVDRQLAQHRADHIGRSYFFCSAGCRDEFQAAPERYG